MAKQSFVVNKSHIIFIINYLDKEYFLNKKHFQLKERFKLFLEGLSVQKKEFFSKDLDKDYNNLIKKLSETIYTSPHIQSQFVFKIADNHKFESLFILAFKDLFKKIGINEKDIDKKTEWAIRFEEKHKHKEKRARIFSYVKDVVLNSLSIFSVVSFCLILFAPSVFVGASIIIKLSSLIASLSAHIALGKLVYESVKWGFNIKYHLNGKELAKEEEIENIEIYYGLEKEDNKYPINLNKKNKYTERKNQVLRYTKFAVLISLSVFSIISLCLISFMPTIFAGTFLALKATSLYATLSTPCVLGYLIYESIKEGISHYKSKKKNEKLSEHIRIDHRRITHEIKKEEIDSLAPASSNFKEENLDSPSPTPRDVAADQENSPIIPRIHVSSHERV